MKYLNPDDDFDATSEQDMNTFLSLMAERHAMIMDTNGCDTLQFHEALQSVEQIEKISSSMNNYWSDCLGNQQIDKLMKCDEYLNDFTTMIVKILDAATSTALRYMDNHLNEKMELNIEEVTDRVKIGMWVSMNETRLTRKALTFEKVGVNFEIPKPFLHHDTRFVSRVMRIPIDVYTIKGYTHETKIINKSRFYVVGDLIHYDVIVPPSQPYTLRAKKWVFREIKTNSDVPKKSPNYPVAVPTKCFIKVPDTVVMSHDLRVASWNKDLMEWTEDGLTDYQYNESDKVVQFYTTVVGTLAFVKNRVIDFPYKKWTLRPRAPEVGDEGFKRLNEKHVRFTVQTIHHDVVIDVMGTMCRLVRPNIIQLGDLLGVDVTPGQLIRKLQSRGINICPVYDDSQYIPGNVAKVG